MSDASKLDSNSAMRWGDRLRELRFPGSTTALSQSGAEPSDAERMSLGVATESTENAPLVALKPTDAPGGKPPVESARIRLRFSKTGDLRWLSHRDLVRTIERLFRRAGVALRMTEGFHPKPRMVFPSALALGVNGVDEVVDVCLVESPACADLLSALNRHSIEGLSFHHAESLASNQSSQAATQSFELPIPSDCLAEVTLAAQRLAASSEHFVMREGRSEPHDIRPFVVQVDVQGTVLCFTLRVINDAGARPRDLLAAVGINDWQSRGLVLTRTRLEMHA